ncbi:DUF4123 domain-containing protein [Pseudomonas mandelii]|uniref:DUF4123 domain-containing protein n=1 Tax=Pseudomonas mandelii TaxID=75612 RepID=A0ABY0VW70_9PSED|nr:DUF4123 domain-containing protein [Pseudomonas mandelii]TWS09568.1 DUF4123 domain-containing protein [Pseudomonas mandelii]SDU59302.1 protein of unknown function [Pseudomonas mandelii]
MRSDLLTPQAWLAEKPLQADERLYLIVSAASDAEALKTLYQNEPMTQATPIWGGTPYAGWQQVMPYLVELKPTSGFLQWIAESDARDWGWLAVSSSTPEVVFEHLRSLTQVRMPDGTEVFFRFWDGRHILPILEGLGDAAGEVLPVFDRYLINGKRLEVGPRVVPPAKDWPWWEVPKTLLDGLAKKNPSTLIGNLMQWLEEERPDIYAAYPESNLKLKIARFVGRPDAPQNLNEVLLNHLILEQG